MLNAPAALPPTLHRSLPPCVRACTSNTSVLFLPELPSLCACHAQDYYEFVESESGDIFTKLGTYAWLAMAIAFVETIMVAKFGKGLFPQPWPRSVLLAWGSAATVFSVAFALWCWQYYIAAPRRLQRQQRANGPRTSIGGAAREKAH